MNACNIGQIWCSTDRQVGIKLGTRAVPLISSYGASRIADLAISHSDATFGALSFFENGKDKTLSDTAFHKADGACAPSAADPPPVEANNPMAKQVETNINPVVAGNVTRGVDGLQVQADG